MKQIIFCALLLRLLIAPLTYHGDVFDSLNWGKDLYQKGLVGFYFRDIPDAGPPNYPPGFYYLLLANQYLYQGVKNLLWKININFPPFPSNLFIYFESDKGRIFFNKLPAIFSDLGIGYLIYLFVSQLKDKKTGLVSASFFLFSPPNWYNSTVWGQTEPLFALPLLGSFYAIYRKRYILAPLCFTISFLIKPTCLLTLPIFFLWWIKETRKSDILKGVILSLVLFYLVHLPYKPTVTLSWILNLYRYGIREVLGYLVANAFNFWAFIFGFEPRLDNIEMLGISAYKWGLIIFGGFVIYFLYKLPRAKDPRYSRSLNKIKRVKDAKIYLSAAALLTFSGFLFLTRIHERYFYLTLLTLAPLLGLDERIKKVFIILSGVHLVNLYHFWWIPRIDFLVKFFSVRVVEQFLTLTNFSVFFYLVKLFKKNYAKT